VNPRGDNGREMPHHDPFDDRAVDALLAGSATRDADAAALASFVDDVRAAAGAVPIPTPALAAALAAGGISTDVASVSMWRRWFMKVQGFFAGLGLAGKIALGAGVAAAATTGAGAAGVLPGPVQHFMATAVHSVTPFELPDPGSHTGHDGHDGVAAGGDTTTSTTEYHGDGGVTPPTEATTPTTEHHGDGGVTPPTEATTPTSARSGDGGGVVLPPVEPTTSTTEQQGGGDSNNPESLVIHCVRTANPPSIRCEWTASTNPDHSVYVLLRVTGDGAPGRVLVQTHDGQGYTDTSVTAGTGYGYRVDSLRADGTVESHSNLFTITCCGDGPPPTTTPTTEHHDGTTTTTIEHHDPTTTTTVR